MSRWKLLVLSLLLMFVIHPALAQNQSASQSLTITIGNVAPTLTGITPDKTLSNASSLSITATGTNFNSSSVVDWNSTALATTCASATTCTATVPASLYASAATYSITVINSGTGGGTSAAAHFTVVAPLAVATTTLPSGSLGVAYSATMTASGGLAPYSWSVTSGTLPAGLSLGASTGVISGTPTAAGSSTITITVTDSYGSLARVKMRTKK
jgi:hypothetical protein